MGSLLGKALPEGNPVDANVQKTSDYNSVKEYERVYYDYDCGIHRILTPIFSYNMVIPSIEWPSPL